ncbi:MAG: hypothetical protein HYU36_10960 [Planctomycetes bacterium]|nr:hypothetical protein [Planctomycetota bacterium]
MSPNSQTPPAVPPACSADEATAARLQRTLELQRTRIRLLEEENASLAARLREQGIPVRTSSAIANELPAPRENPTQRDAALANLETAERQLAEELLGSHPIFLFFRTETRADVGRWFSRGRVAAAATDRDLVLFAAGPRPYAEAIPFTNLHRSLYNHVTGELILAPAREVRLTRIQISPADGYQLLAQIYQEPSNHA